MKVNVFTLFSLNKQAPTIMGQKQSDLLTTSVCVLSFREREIQLNTVANMFWPKEPSSKDKRTSGRLWRRYQTRSRVWQRIWGTRGWSCKPDSRDGWGWLGGVSSTGISGLKQRLPLMVPWAEWHITSGLRHLQWLARKLLPQLHRLPQRVHSCSAPQGQRKCIAIG